MSSRAVGGQLSISDNTVELLRTRLAATALTQADLSALDNEAFAIRLGTIQKLNFDERFALLLDAKTGERAGRKIERLLKAAKMRQVGCVWVVN